MQANLQAYLKVNFLLAAYPMIILTNVFVNLSVLGNQIQ